MKKIISACLCAALLSLALASCRGVAEIPFDVSNFIPEAATVEELSAAHAIYEISGVTLQQTVEYYEVALAFVGSKQLMLNDTSEDFWDYTGTYGEKHVVRITMRATGDKVRVLVNYLDEMRQPQTSVAK